MIEYFLRLLAILCTQLPVFSTPDSLTLHLYCAPECPPCEEQKIILSEMAADDTIPHRANIIVTVRDNTNSELFAAENISRYPTIILKDADGKELRRHEGLCSAAEILKLFAPAGSSPGKSFLRGTVTDVSLTTPCRNSRYPNWNCTLLLQPAAGRSRPVVLIMPCRREDNYPALPEPGSLINAEIIPWDKAPEEIRSMGLLDDQQEYSAEWFYSPDFTTSAFAADKDLPY